MSPHSIRSIHHPEFDKNHYIIKHPIITKLIYLFGIITWIITFVAYFNFFNLDLAYWALFFPPIFVLTVYNIISYGINFFYKKPNLKEHIRISKLFVESSYRPSVDILLPICGEPIEILRRTWDAVAKLDYPNFKAFVLDDKGKPELEELAKQYGFTYLSRPNKGEMKKAGNLKYAFERTSGDYFVIFDADFAPLPEFINETVPYMLKDPKMGILQTPQYFEVHSGVSSKCWLEYGAGAIQEDFYRMIQVSRDGLGGSICVGTCAMYRRSALTKIGGTHQIEHSEDVWTGIKVNEAGYTVRYNPFILAQGFCPDDSEAFFKQQYRWCKGSMSLMTDPNFWKLDIPVSAKMCFISGFLYYITSFFNYIFAFIGILIIAFNSDKLSLQNAYPFFPYIFFTYVMLPMIRIHSFSVGNIISRLLAQSAYCLALYHTLFDWNMGWSPTGVKTKRDFWITFSFFFNLAFFCAYMISVIWLLVSGKVSLVDINHYIVLVWIFINIFSYLVFLVTMAHDMYIKHIFARLNFFPKHHHTKWFYFGSPIAIILMITGLFVGLAGNNTKNANADKPEVQGATQSKKDNSTKTTSSSSTSTSSSKPRPKYLQNLIKNNK
jgi:cellulose synthase (UDP-forming)